MSDELDNSDNQAGQVKVNDEFVELNSLAILKCRPSNNNIADFHYLTEWFTSDGLQIKASETIKLAPANGNAKGEFSSSSWIQCVIAKSEHIHEFFF